MSPNSTDLNDGSDVPEWIYNNCPLKNEVKSINVE